MKYRIPLFDLNFDDAEERAILDVLSSRWLSIGPKNAELERRFAAMIGAAHAVSLTNCTAALHVALRLLDIGPGDEVIVPSLTFIATVNAVRYVGAAPVFCDIAGPHDLNMDPERAESLVSKRTKAILLMHYAGFPCDMERYLAIAAKRGLSIIEDASHAPLSEYRGRKLGTIGDVGCFSFFSNKNVSTGEGGMLVTNVASYDTRARLLRSHGMTTLSYDRAMGHAVSYDVVELGYNYRMDDVRAAIGLAQLDKLPGDLAKRTALRKRYVEKLSGIGGVIIPFAANTEPVSNYIFPIVLENSNAERRDMIRNRLHEHGIQTSIHYPAVHRFTIYRRYGGKLDRTEYAADNEITLPIYGHMRFEDVDDVAETLSAAVT